MPSNNIRLSQLLLLTFNAVALFSVLKPACTHAAALVGSVPLELQCPNFRIAIVNGVSFHFEVRLA